MDFLFALALILQEPSSNLEDANALEQQAEILRDAARSRALEAEAVAAEIAQLQLRLVEAAERVRIREAEADSASERLKRLEAEEAQLVTRLASERNDLARVLAALQRIELADPPAMAVSPDDAVEAARAAGLLAYMAPALEARAKAVTDRLKILEVLRAELNVQVTRVDAAKSLLNTTRSEVKALIDERQALELQLRDEAGDLSKRAQRAANQAETLRDLIAEIRRFAATEPRLAPRLKPEESSDETMPVPRLRPMPTEPNILVSAQPLEQEAKILRFADMRGRLRPPARGRVEVRVGEEGPDGVRREGVWFKTSSRGQVSAPFDGMVVFTGNFPGLEGVLMINTSDGYTLVLGGLAVVYASEGQSVLAGEPVGLMPESENPMPMLYMEIRRDTDNADDPEIWLRPEFRRG